MFSVSSCQPTDSPAEDLLLDPDGGRAPSPPPLSPIIGSRYALAMS